MHLGEVIAIGRPADVLSHPDVITSYLGDDDVAIRRSGRARRSRRSSTKEALLHA